MKKLFFIITLLIPVSGWAQFTFVGSVGAGELSLALTVTAPNSTSTVNSQCTTSSCNTSGAQLIVVMAAYFGTGVNPCSNSTLTDSFGNTYTQGPDFIGNAGTVSITSYYAINPTVGTGHTWTCAAGSQQFTVLNVMFFRGGLAKDQTSGTVNTTAAITTIQPGSVTPTQNNELLVLGCTSNEGTTQTFSVDSGFTKTSDMPATANGSVHGAGFYLIQSTAAAVNPTCTNSASTSAGLGAALITFKFGGNLSGTAGNSSMMLTGVGR